MKKINISYILLILYLLLFFTCKLKKTEYINYREKNPTNILSINSTDGNINITGWKEDFIEIKTKKTLFSGINADLNLLDTLFEHNINELNITTKKPVRIDGKVDLEIKIPFKVIKIFIKTTNSNIKINNYLGDIDISNSNGNNNIDFYGNLLRINSSYSTTNLDINSKNMFDCILKNDHGDIILNINDNKGPSFLDIRSINANIYLFINKNINHNITAINDTNSIDLHYDMINEKYTNNDKFILKAFKGENINDITIYISNTNGIISLYELKK